MPLLAARGLRLSKRLGQNFLVDAALADAIVADAGVTRADLVIEVGAGAGGLTQPLLASAGRVVAVELDRGLAALLREHLGDEPRLRFAEGDALEGDEGLHPVIVAALDGARDAGFERALLVANLPYACGTPVLARLLRRDRAPDVIVAMLQREVVERLRAAPGSADYGPLAVLRALRADIEIVRRVPRDVFFPRPAVESTVFRLTPWPAAEARVARAAADVAAIAFRRRRKRLAGALRGAVSEATIRAAGLDPDVRPQQIAPEGWARLAAATAEGA